jgi:hypothetical protein
MYSDYADCDVVPMEACSLLLGRPWNKPFMWLLKIQKKHMNHLQDLFYSIQMHNQEITGGARSRDHSVRQYQTERLKYVYL